jgi:hypothetical protein
MASIQQGDVSLFNTVDGGNITIESGVTTMSGGLETAAYLSLFGGNEDDDLTTGTLMEWWGNGLETDPAYKYRSETQYLLTILPPTSGNLLRIEEAANRDLKWFKDKNIATDVEALVTIPELNKVMITVNINVEGEITTIEFLANWKADI